MQRRLLISVPDVAPTYEEAVGKLLAASVASALSYGPSALSAAAAEGFAIVEDHRRVWPPTEQRTLDCGLVVTWASRSPGRTTSRYSDLMA